MSIEQLQSRLADLKFSAEEFKKQLQKEHDDSADEYSDWEDGDQEDGEPEIVDHQGKIDALDKAINHVEDAISKLDEALDD